jgi:hypothetical protein
MSKLVLNKKEMKLLNQMRKKRLERLKRAFYAKKQNHLNSEKYKKFNELIKVKPSDILFEFQFRSSFSLYLYLYLKTIAEFYPDVGISNCLEINFEELKRLSGLCKNTIKKSFWELVDCGLIVFDEEPTVKKHNLCKSVMIFDDRFLVAYDDVNGRIIYSIKNKV